MGTYGARLREERERLGLSQAEFAALGGVARRAQIRYESDERVPDLGYLSGLARAGVDVPYVVGGERGSPEDRAATGVVFETIAAAGGGSVDAQAPGRVMAAVDGREFVLLPRYDVTVSAGSGTVVRSEQVVDYLAFSADWFHKNVGISPASAALIEVRGDSMTPVLQDGELVIVDTSCDAFKDDAIYVLQYSGALRIKNVRRRLDGKIEIKSANEGYGLELLTEQEAEAGTITIVGRARWALSGRRLP